MFFILTRENLQWLGICRRVGWERPTVADIILDSPITYLAAIIYHIILFLRGRPFTPPRDKPRIRVVCISDTHDQTVSVPDGDLLIHAGDLTNKGTIEDIQKQLDWLDSLPHREKVVVCGNHDSYFDPTSRSQDDRDSGKTLDFKSIHYLERSSVKLEFPGSRKLKVYGAPDIPACGGADFAFQYNKRLHPPWNNMIPMDTDILVTHTPPFGHLDLELGCPTLLEEVWRVKPRLHVFGHVHWGHGHESVYFDECQKAYETLRARAPLGLVRDIFPHAGWVDAFKIVYHGINSILWKWLMLGPGGNTGSMMVNAAQMLGNTQKMGNKAQVVDI